MDHALGLSSLEIKVTGFEGGVETLGFYRQQNLVRANLACDLLVKEDDGASAFSTKLFPLQL